jgi:TPR repeat protein
LINRQQGDIVMQGTIRKQLFFVIAILAGATPAWADYKAGLTAYNHHDYKTAYNEWHALAEKGDADGQFGLGRLYHNGYGVSQDYGQAKGWYEKAAAQGHGGAMANLGLLYLYGDGVPQSLETARAWFEKAVALKNVRGAYFLGLMHENGWGFPQDAALAKT